MKKIVTIVLTLAFSAGLWAQHVPSHTAAFHRDSIEFWVGSGSNSASFIISWDDEATPAAYIWGIHFSTATVMASDLLDSIAAYDPRFTYSGSNSSGFVSWMYYDDEANNIHHHGTSGSYWCYDHNSGNAGVYGQEQVHDGDSLQVSSSCYFYDVTVQPATNPNPNTDPDPVDATIDSASILYWVGEGSNYAIMAVNWATPADTALAWGYRFNDSVSLTTMMDDIAAADAHLSCLQANGFLNDIIYVMENGDTLKLAPSTPDQTYGNYWIETLNGYSGMGLADVIRSGDFVKWGDATIAIGLNWDSVHMFYRQNVWVKRIVPAPISMAHGPFCGAVGTEGCEAIAADSNIIVAWATGCTVERGWQDIATQSARVSYGSANMAIGPVDKSDNMSVVSLGDGGTATLTFANAIMDGDGFDFCVFENSFNDNFLELAFVEVSSDGSHFVRFPSTSLTPTTTQIGGMGSVDPTFIDNLAGKYRMGYGTPFDLSELADSTNLDISHITHIRLVDVVGSIAPQYGSYDAYGHLVNDPYPTTGHASGFDLDGIGVMHQQIEGIETGADIALQVYPNPTSNVLNISMQGNTENAILRLFDITGREVVHHAVNGNSVTINVETLPKGIYILRIADATKKIVVK